MRPTRVWFVVVALLCCAFGACNGRKVQLPPIAAATDPLAALTVRLDVIQGAAPENPVIQEQAAAAKENVVEASAGVQDLQQLLQREREACAARVKALEADLVEARSDERKALAEVDRKHRARVNLIRLGCIFGIPLGIVAACSPTPWGRWFAVLPVACVITLGAIAVEGFTWKYAMPIGAVALGLVVLLVIVVVLVYLLGSKQLVESGDALIARLGGKQAVKQQLDEIQSPVTQGLVKALQGQLGAVGRT